MALRHQEKKKQAEIDSFVHKKDVIRGIIDRTKSSNEVFQSNIDTANRDIDEQWAKVCENISNLKELVHVLYDQKVEGQKKLNQIKKTFDCLGYEED